MVSINKKETIPRSFSSVNKLPNFVLLSAFNLFLNESTPIIKIVNGFYLGKYSYHNYSFQKHLFLVVRNW